MVQLGKITGQFHLVVQDHGPVGRDRLKGNPVVEVHPAKPVRIQSYPGGAARVIAHIEPLRIGIDPHYQGVNICRNRDRVSIRFIKWPPCGKGPHGQSQTDSQGDDQPHPAPRLHFHALRTHLSGWNGQNKVVDCRGHHQVKTQRPECVGKKVRALDNPGRTQGAPQYQTGPAADIGHPSRTPVETEQRYQGEPHGTVAAGKRTALPRDTRRVDIPIRPLTAENCHLIRPGTAPVLFQDGVDQDAGTDHGGQHHQQTVRPPDSQAPAQFAHEPPDEGRQGYHQAGDGAILIQPQPRLFVPHKPAPLTIIKAGGYPQIGVRSDQDSSQRQQHQGKPRQYQPAAAAAGG